MIPRLPLYSLNLALVVCSTPLIVAEEPPLLQIEDRVLHPVPRELFGQFLERATWHGERGPEAALDAEGRLRADVTELIRSMNIPLMRFPGGSNVDFQNWTDLIDHVPGRTGPRPPTTWRNEDNIPTRFGLEEYFQLARTIGSETILVVNFLDAVAQKKPLDQAALDAAGLVAYANAPLGAALPAGMPDWPAIRARNGHPEPHRVRYFQIGNEWWMKRYAQAIHAALGTQDPATVSAWITRCARTYIEKMKAVDPSILIIVEGAFMGPEVWRPFHSDPFIRAHTHAFSAHFYSPMDIKQVRHQGEVIPAQDADPEGWWNFLTTRLTTPGPENIFPLDSNKLNPWREFQKPAAITEWNWNGWTALPSGQRPPFDPVAAAGLSAASALHGMMRAGPAITLATQSMLVGNHWNITAVRVGPDQPARFMPQGIVAALYSSHHGTERLESRIEGGPAFRLTVTANEDRPPAGTFPVLDAVVTRSPSHVFIHILNRDFRRDHPLRLRLPWNAATATHRFVQFRQDGRWDDLTLQTRSLEDLNAIVLPARSVSVLQIPRPAP